MAPAPSASRMLDQEGIDKHHDVCSQVEQIDSMGLQIMGKLEQMLKL